MYCICESNSVELQINLFIIIIIIIIIIRIIIIIILNNAWPLLLYLSIDVYLGADRLDQSNCIDYLGVTLDAHLTWHSQIDAVCKKRVFAIFRLSSLRNLIAPHIMLRIYQCIIQKNTRLCNYRMGIQFATKSIESAAFTKSSCPNNNRQL